MSSEFIELIEGMRGQSVASVAAHPYVQQCKALRVEVAGQFIADYRKHLDETGPVAKSYGAAADIAAYAVATSILPYAVVDPELLLAHVQWPSAEAWDQRMLAYAEAGLLTTDQIVRALKSDGFSQKASMLMPFGNDAWAVALRNQVARWPAKRKTAWTTLIRFARTTDLPLKPSEEWLSVREVRVLAKALEPCMRDFVDSMLLFALPVDPVNDRTRASKLTRAAEENAKLLHALMLFMIASRPSKSDEVFARIREVSLLEIPGLGKYLPRLAHRIALGPSIS